MFSVQISHIHRACLLLLVMVFAFGVVGSAEAAKKKKKDDKDKGKSFTVTEQMGKRLTAAHEALEAEQYEAAAEILVELEKRSKRLTPYERAIVFQMLGMTEASQEKYEQALVYFEKCLSEDALPHGAIVSTRFTIAQLYMATDEFEKAVKALEMWFKEVETASGNAYYLLAAAYYQLDEIKKAIVPAETAIKVSKKPKPPWLQLLVGLYYETKQYPKAVKPLEMLIMIDPKKSYWTQLSSLYAHLEQEEKSLAIMQLAYAQGYLTKDSDLRALAQLYLYHSLPYQAGVVLEKAGADDLVEKTPTYWEMLANSWLLAREAERAFEPLRTGAEVSEEGSLYARLGQLYIEREEWANASAALEKAIAKGDLHDEHTTHLLLAISYHHQQKYSAARKHLRLARNSETETLRNSANQWLLMVDREVQALADAQSEREEEQELAAKRAEEALQAEEEARAQEEAEAEEADASPEEVPAAEQVSQTPQEP
jgi:tetratricopeptide (TPR) repeat protein